MRDGEHIRPLTSLRFFAALWVVLFHYWPKLDGPAAPAIVERGYLGVELFFTLSGFILCHVYLKRFGEGGFTYGSFLWNRLARVYPLHLFCLVGVGALALAATAAGFGVDPNILSWPSLPANLLLVHAWGFAPAAGWNHPSWSISAEWFAYLSFPAFAAVAWALRKRPWLFAAIAIGFVAVIHPLFQSLAGFPLSRATIAWGALRIVPCFFLGCAMHRLWRSQQVPGRKGPWGALFFGAAVMLAAQAGAPDAVIVMGFGGLILYLAHLAETGIRLGSERAFVYLGEISYSVYMICIPWMIVFVNAAAKLLSLPDEKLPLPVWMFLLIAVVPLSAASYHLVEKPARERMKLIADGWKQRRVAAA
ncbi:MAG: acyltransferase [Caulobacterales bacterium 68-7]|nr:acyltransferase [Caulobacterales bacterium]OJU12482.1 MAG: acyltransferase [Caulobacterales bacterium 68-7]